MDTRKALDLARSKELDLLLVAPNAQPPVAKIVEFSKFLYDERKKASAAKAKSKKSELKELRFGPSTDGGDIKRYTDRASEFLSDGNRVKVTVRMRGREGMFPEVAFQKLKKVEEGLKEVGKVEAPPKRVGQMVWEVFSPK